MESDFPHGTECLDVVEDLRFLPGEDNHVVMIAAIFMGLASYHEGHVFQIDVATCADGKRQDFSDKTQILSWRSGKNSDPKAKGQASLLKENFFLF